MDLELEAIPLACFNASHGRFPCPWDTAEGIVLGGI
jgi:hypothetical protein